MTTPETNGRGDESGPRADSTFALLERARAGDREAVDRLFQRYLPALSRWAAGRLPQWARGLADTSDIVQETLLKTFKKIEGFDYRGEGALYGYLRQAVMNRIRDELRRARRAGSVELAEADAEIDPAASPLDQSIGRERVERYEAALARLKPEERDAIVARIELELPYDEIAVATGKPTANAARMTVARALVRLAEEMNRG